LSFAPYNDAIDKKKKTKTEFFTKLITRIQSQVIENSLISDETTLKTETDITDQKKRLILCNLDFLTKSG
jgi:hypothetical protein